MKLFFLGPLLAAGAAATAAAPSPIAGNWTNPGRSVTVRIAPCGGNAMCARVTAASARAKADADRGGTARLIGTELMSGLTATGDGGWSGEIFVPDVNRRAAAQVRLAGADRLIVQGCALGGLLCKEQQWTRVAVAKARRRR